MNQSDHYQRKKGVGIYCRLSNEDGENTLSNSIENQKNILTKYAIENKLNIYDSYVDDGYTGTNFDRPGFKRLLRDIENGHISIVITKDMSRLGRDYIQVGFYIEKYFPEAGVRYIAVNDGVDTQKDNQNELTPFKAVINDMYSKDISKKIRSVFELKRKMGKFIGAFAPFGYKKDPDDKNRLIIDQETSWIVKKIFNMYLSGKGLKVIANYLNEESIPPPAVYKARNIKSYHPTQMKIGKWCHSGVKHILTNRTYTGDLAQGKTKKINYKSKKIKRLKREDWLIVKDTHEPIISRETFKWAQDLMQEKNKSFKGAKKGVKLFSGFSFCGNCGGVMTYHKMPKGYYFLICSTYKKYGKKECTRHAILEKKLEKMILEDFKDLVNRFVNKEILKKEAEKILNQEKGKEEVYKEELKLVEKRVEEIRGVLKVLYEDKAKGFLEEKQLLDLYHQFNDENQHLLNRRGELLKKLGSKNNNKEDNKVEKLIYKVLNLKGFNRLILTQLIDKIEVFEDQKVRVHYKFKRLY
ncbi:recombinase family protein [Crassaminicella profunda]|uniref:recombinase family protein n=1 Tax=Crassaminicella profunda TaxID=1286698 RepID=UPI001CA612F6|nr:recombinase family protein [Crassaminicella profunda]QZY55452.1 recombinase family protein [Crassaminicella profunda]